MLGRIPEPHELADAYYAEQDAQYERLCEGKRCSDCNSYYAAPDEWCDVPHGWCDEFLDHVLGDAPVKGYCDNFKEN